MVGRLVGYLAVCDPPEPTIGELAEALLASRSAITGAVKVLETLHAVARSRAAGERMDRVRIDLSRRSRWVWTSPSTRSCASWRGRASRSCGDAPPERRAVLLETSAFADFLIEQMPRLNQEWEARREALVASGDLPEKRPGDGGNRDRFTSARRSWWPGCGRRSARRPCSTASTCR